MAKFFKLDNMDHHIFAKNVVLHIQGSKSVKLEAHLGIKINYFTSTPLCNIMIIYTYPKTLY